jgi:hypothetical protein
MEYSSDALAQAAYVSNDTYSASELVTNGLNWTGATGTTPPNNWTNKSQGTDTYTIESGTLKLLTVDWNAWIQQIITVVTGQKYQLYIDLKNYNCGNGMNIKLGTSSNGGEYYNSFETETTKFVTHNVIFTATSTTLYVDIENSPTGANQYGWVDNCSIRGLALQSYSESTIKTQGSYSLKGVAAATDSLNKTLTRTIT